MGLRWMRATCADAPGIPGPLAGSVMITSLQFKQLKQRLDANGRFKPARRSDGH
jgi:hypothetical protein